MSPAPLVESLAKRREMLRTRACYACLHTVPEPGGVYHADLQILTHVGKCSEVVNRERRDYGNSKRGRWRSKWAVLAIVTIKRGAA